MLDAIRMLALALVMGPPGTDGPPAAPSPAPKPEGPATTLTLPGQDTVRPFVPLHPRTAEEQARLDSLREYVSARAMEDQRRLGEAVRILEKGLEKDRESVPILRRLAKLCFAQGRIKPAIEYSRRVVEIDPNDTATIELLSDHYRLKNDAAGAEALLNGVLANPKMEKAGARLPARPERPGRPGLGSPRPGRQGRRRLCQGRRGPGHQGRQPHLRRRPEAHPGGRRGQGIPEVRRRLRQGQAASTSPSRRTAAAWSMSRSIPACPARSPSPC